MPCRVSLCAKLTVKDNHQNLAVLANIIQISEPGSRNTLDKREDTRKNHKNASTDSDGEPKINLKKKKGPSPPCVISIT